MAFLAYIDASGSGIDPNIRVISVGGFVAHEDVWAEFEGKWCAVLRQFGITALHMKDYAHSTGEFTAWRGDNDKRRAFMVEIAGVIRNTRVQAFGSSLPLGLYRLFNQRYCLEEKIGAPYTMAAWLAFASGTEWRDRHHINEPIVFYVEKGDNQQSDFRRYLTERVIWEDDYIAEPIFLPKKQRTSDGTIYHVVPFQACDFVAYEQAKALTDLIVHRKTQVRQSLRNALPAIEDIPDGRTYWRLMEGGSFENAMINFQVPKRYNHFRGNFQKQKRIIDPLCYLDGQPMKSYIYGNGYLKDDPYGQLGDEPQTK